jgi:hypothetical protein
MKHFISILLVVLSTILILAGCDKKNPTEAEDVTTYVGTFVATSGTTGVVTLTVEGTKVSGEAKFYVGTSLQTRTISGTLTNNTLSGTASDGASFAGTLSGDRITGTINGADATFSVTKTTSPDQVEIFLGGYSSTSGTSESGTLNICVSGTTMWGVAVSSGSTSRTDLIGTISGNTVTVRRVSDNAQVATGTKSGNTWSGTYAGSSSSGTWIATLFQ